MNTTHHAAPATGATHTMRIDMPKPSLGSPLRRPETGSFIGLVSAFTFISIFGGESFLTL